MTTRSAVVKLTWDQAFFFRAKEKKRTRPFPLASKTKREEGPPDRRLLQIRVVHRCFFFSDNSTVRVRVRAGREKIKIKGTIVSFPTPNPLHLR